MDFYLSNKLEFLNYSKIGGLETFGNQKKKPALSAHARFNSIVHNCNTKGDRLKVFGIIRYSEKDKPALYIEGNIFFTSDHTFSPQNVRFL